jgi:DNA-binding NtrC family response regulator
MEHRARCILIVDDNESLRRAIALALRDRYAEVEEASDAETAVARLCDVTQPTCDAVVTDLRLPGADGMAVLRAARERDPAIQVLVMTAYGSVSSAVEAMREGAFDFLEKPFDLEQLELRLERALAHRGLEQEVRALRRQQGRGGLIGRSAALAAAVDLARRAAPTRSTVLVTGETGTGKELLAGLVHEASPRAGARLVKVNCAAVPETLLESELFGHERGAFTGADRRRVGRFEEATGGTLFLDEIGELTPATQVKLLRVLQDQEFQRLGGTQSLRTDARIVVATNADLPAAVREGRFREDLFFRLDVIRICLPPLRERPEDAVMLAQHFLAELSETRSEIEGFSRGALRRIREYAWPGNVRELRNAVERAALMAEAPRIRAADLDLNGPTRGRDAAWRPALPPQGWDLDDWLRALVVEALEQTQYVQKEAAARLGVSRRKLNYMISRMGITHARWRRHRGPADLVVEQDEEALDSEGAKLNSRRPPGDQDIGKRLHGTGVDGAE